MFDLFYFGAFFSSLLSAYLIIFKRGTFHKIQDKLLAFLFLSYGFSILGYLLVTSGWIIFVPNFYRIPAPINFLIPPLAYLYVRTVLRNEETIRKIDFLHFIPAFLVLLNYLPLYFSSYQEKMKIVQLVIQNFDHNYTHQDGFLPETIQFLRPIQSIFYIIIQWRLIVKYKNSFEEVQYKDQTRIILTWLRKFTLVSFIHIASFLVFIFAFFYYLLFDQQLKDLYLLATIPVGITSFYVTSYIILNPDIFIGIPKSTKGKKIDSAPIFDKVKYEQEIVKLKAYMLSEMPYLKHGYTINELSLAIEVPSKRLSFIINSHFNKNFNDYINSYRLEFINNRILKDEANLYTIYSIAIEAGFANKTSFLNAFNKQFNCNPSTYIRNCYNLK